MIYEDLLAFWLAFIIWEFIPTSLNHAHPALVKILLFIAKETLFFALLFILRQRFSPLSNPLPSSIGRAGLLLLFFFYILDLTYFGLKGFLYPYYFSSFFVLLWFLHYYLAYKLILYPLKFGYLRILLGLLLPFFILLFLDEALEYLGLSFKGQFLLTLSIVLLLSPYLIIKIWPVKKMPRGPLRDMIAQFLRIQKIKLRDFLIIPPIGAKFYTAGILGFIPPFRYLFFSSSLLEILREEEILGVVAHEIGHLKKRHGYLLFFVLLTFPLFLSNLFYLFLLGFSFFFATQEELISFLKSPKGVYLDIALSLWLLAFAILFFRFVFAYFLRNLEREADLYALYLLKDPEPLTSALYKIGEITGQLFRKSWHHFGLWERIKFIRYASYYPEIIKKHSRKIRKFLALWFLINLLPLLLFLFLEGDILEKILKNFLSWVS